MKKILLHAFATISVVFCLVSCYPDGPDNTEDYDVAMTTYNRSLSDSFWSSLNTFAIPDSIVYVGVSSDYQRNVAFDTTILAYVIDRFADNGYTPVSESSENPDFVVTLTMSVNTYYNWNNWYDYWGWYPGWSGWWGFDGPWSPYWNTGYVYAYRSGSLIIDMLYPVASADSTTLSMAWTGIADGVLAGSTSNLITRTENMIDQCFEQSPYLFNE